MSKGSAALFAVCLVLARATSANAQDDKSAARELFRAGEVAFSRNEYRAAAIAFEAANEKSPNGGAMYNAGVAWTRASEPTRAADAFETALDGGTLPDGQLGDARTRRGALERRLGVLVVAGPAGSSFTVGHVNEARPPRRVHLRPGQHLVRLRLASGEREARVIRIFAAGVTKLSLDAPPPPEPGEPPPPLPHRAPASVGGDSGTRSDGATLGWVLVSAGAVSAGAGVVLLTRGLSERDAFERSDRTDTTAHDRAISYRTWSTVTLFGGAALCGTGAVLLLTGKPEPGAPRVSLTVGAGSVSLVARGL